MTDRISEAVGRAAAALQALDAVSDIMQHVDEDQPGRRVLVEMTQQAQKATRMLEHELRKAAE